MAELRSVVISFLATLAFLNGNLASQNPWSIYSSIGRVDVYFRAYLLGQKWLEAR